MTKRVGLEVDTMTIRIPIRLQRRGGRKLIMTPEGVAAPTRKPRRDETLLKALVRAHRWRRKIESGQAHSITDIAEQEGVTDAYSEPTDPLFELHCYESSWGRCPIEGMQIRVPDPARPANVAEYGESSGISTLP